jgi:hypothetical protein
MFKKIHAWFSVFLWTLWAAGLGTTALSRFQYHHENDRLFWDFVLPYNEIIHIISYIPIAPVLFLLAFVKSKQENKRCYKTVALFLLTAFLWLVYLSLYIRWTVN